MRITPSWFFLLCAIGIPVAIMGGVILLVGGKGDGEGAGWLGLIAAVVALLAFLFFGALAFLAARPGNVIVRLLRSIALFVFGALCVSESVTLFRLMLQRESQGLVFAVIITFMLPVGLAGLYYSVRGLFSPTPQATE